MPGMPQIRFNRSLDQRFAAIASKPLTTIEDTSTTIATTSSTTPNVNISTIMPTPISFPMLSYPTNLTKEGMDQWKSEFDAWVENIARPWHDAVENTPKTKDASNDTQIREWSNRLNSWMISNRVTAPPKYPFANLPAPNTTTSTIVGENLEKYLEVVYTWATTVSNNTNETIPGQGTGNTIPDTNTGQAGQGGFTPSDGSDVDTPKGEDAPDIIIEPLEDGSNPPSEGTEGGTPDAYTSNPKTSIDDNNTTRNIAMGVGIVGIIIAAIGGFFLIKKMKK